MMGFYSQCWEYTSSGWYGNTTIDGKPVSVHRAAYEVLVGPIPSGLVIDHLCRTPGCYNPTHLEAVTNGENLRRGIVARGRSKQHGTISMYTTGRCRCADCRSAMAEYARERYRRDHPEAIHRPYRIKGRNVA